MRIRTMPKSFGKQSFIQALYFASLVPKVVVVILTHTIVFGDFH